MLHQLGPCHAALWPSPPLVKQQLNTRASRTARAAQTLAAYANESQYTQYVCHHMLPMPERDCHMPDRAS